MHINGVGYMPQKINAIIFDFGGVLSHPQNETNKQGMIQLLGIEEREFTESYFHYRSQYDAGLIPGRQYWTRIGAVHNIKIAPDDIQKLITLDVQSWTMMNQTMLDYHFAIQATNIKTAVLSNMTWDILSYIRKHYTWIINFHTRIFSCEHHVTKPNKTIYHICLNALNESPEHCIFFDDSLTNVQSAEDLGINARWFQSEHDVFENIFVQYPM